MRPQDEPALRELLARAGCEPWPALAPQAAGAPPRAWVLEREGRVVGACASAPSATWIEGEERVFARVAPPVLEPRGGAALAAAGERLAARVAETLAPGGDLVLHALVHEDDWRAAERGFGLEIVRTQSAHRFDLAEALSADAPGAPPVEALAPAALGPDVRWLWDRCADGLGASAIRDARFLAERLGGHGDTRLLGVRDGAGVLRGYAALRPGAPEATLDDWLVPPAEAAVGDALLVACARTARAAGARWLCAALPAWSAWCERFQERGALVVPTPWLVAARAQLSRHDTFWLRDTWWVQPLDFAPWCGRGAPRFAGAC